MFWRMIHLRLSGISTPLSQKSCRTNWAKVKLAKKINIYERHILRKF